MRVLWHKIQALEELTKIAKTYVEGEFSIESQVESLYINFGWDSIVRVGVCRHSRVSYFYISSRDPISLENLSITELKRIASLIKRAKQNIDLQKEIKEIEELLEI